MTSLPQTEADAIERGIIDKAYNHECRKAEAMLKHRWVHIAVRNVLLNEIGITRDNVLQFVADRVDKVVREEVGKRFDSLDRLVGNEIAKLMGEKPSRYGGDPFLEVIKKEIKQQIQDTVIRNMALTLNVAYTGENVIKPVKDSDRVTCKF